MRRPIRKRQVWQAEPWCRMWVSARDLECFGRSTGLRTWKRLPQSPEPPLAARTCNQ